MQPAGYRALNTVLVRQIPGACRVIDSRTAAVQITVSIHIYQATVRACTGAPVIAAPAHPRARSAAA